MGALRKSICYIQIEVLLSFAVLVINGERYIVTSIANQNVSDVNRGIVSGNVQTVMQCARKCQGANCTSFSYGEKLGSTECFPTTSRAYSGRQARTASGLTCQRWDAQIPHRHSRTNPSAFPDLTLADAANFCRDPDGEKSPWCYTMNPDLRWEYCSVDQCNFEFQHEKCYHDTLTAKDYNGPWNRTRSGKVCQRWDAQSPHSHTYTSSSGYPDNTISDAENYCRDPSESGYTWCYTMATGTRWEACDVTSCAKYLNDKKCYDTESFLQYTGSWDMTVNHIKCQRWDSLMPHNHTNTDPAYFPDDTVEDAGNYCRDPDDSGYLWCYSMDPGILRFSCGMWKCPANHVTCNDSPTVRSYMGTWSKTKSGKVCQRWDSQLPHSHSLTAEMFEEDTLTDAENFCRDPTESGQLWCYTTDPETPIENCGITKCSGVTTCQTYHDETLYDGSNKSEQYTKEP